MEQNVVINNISEIMPNIEQMVIGDTTYFYYNTLVDNDVHIPVIKLSNDYFRIGYTDNVNDERVSLGNIENRIATEIIPRGGYRKKQKRIKLKSRRIKQKGIKQKGIKQKGIKQKGIKSINIKSRRIKR